MKTARTSGHTLSKAGSNSQFRIYLHAADAVYHKVCDSNFRNGGNVPQSFQTAKTTGPAQASKTTCVGRPADQTKADAFEKVLDYVTKNNDEQLTVSDLKDKMAEFSGGETYTVPYIKQKLSEHFGNSIIFTEINGKPNVVTFRTTAQSILMSFFETPEEEDTNAEKMRLVKAAAALIRNDVRSTTASKAFYPSQEEQSKASWYSNTWGNGRPGCQQLQLQTKSPGSAAECLNFTFSSSRS